MLEIYYYSSSIKATVRIPSAGSNHSAIPPIDSTTTNRTIALPWTSLYGTSEKDSYHFFSAYYDDRVSAPHRPAVVVLGYVYNSVPTVPLYCSFQFSDGSTVCGAHPAPMQGNPHDTHLTKTFQYFCELRVKKEPPLTVAISNVSNCDPAFLSGKIPVRNRERPNKNTTLKKFGVCLGGVVVQKGNDDKMLKDLVEFIEMNRLLGAEIFTFYINEMQLSAKILRHILDHCSSN